MRSRKSNGSDRPLRCTDSELTEFRGSTTWRHAQFILACREIASLRHYRSHPIVVAPIDLGVFLFLLPGGRPRLLAVISAIHEGGRPRLRPRPRAKRSRLR